MLNNANGRLLPPGGQELLLQCHTPAGWKHQVCFVFQAAWRKSRFVLKTCVPPESPNPEHSDLRVEQSSTCLTCVPVQGTSGYPRGPWNERQGPPGLPPACTPWTTATSISPGRVAFSCLQTAVFQATWLLHVSQPINLLLG